MSDAPPLDKDLVRRHSLDVIEALTDDDHPPCPHGGAPDPVTGAYCPGCLTREEVPEPRLLEDVTPVDLSVLHRAANCRCFVAPVVPDPAPVLLVCPECQQGKHGNCDSTAWDTLADEPGACSCTHPGFGQPEWSPDQIERLRAALTEPVLPAPVRVHRERHPYVGEGPDGCRRSADIDRSEADTHPRGSEEWSRLLASAAEWELQAAWLEGKR